MRWRFGTASDIGGRDEQQDRVTIIESSDGDGYLIAVADGMGGYEGGALAAQAVIDTANPFFETPIISDPHSSLDALCTAAHRAIVEMGEPGQPAPGSTCVLLYLTADEACWAHVGDSRLYHFRNGKLLTRTQDHSMAQALAARGEMTEAEIAASPLQNQLYMRLGGTQEPIPEFGAAEVQPGDFFMLCSDGFWASIDPKEVAAAMSDDDLQAAAERLVQLAKERAGGSGDNITVAMAQFRRKPRKFGLFSWNC
jgi:serine/threonine protein phosphatase PrpC